MENQMENDTVIGRMIKRLHDSQATAGVYLANGIRLVGTILEYDEESILLSSKGHDGIAINRCNISTVQHHIEGDQQRRK